MRGRAAKPSRITANKPGRDSDMDDREITVVTNLATGEELAYSLPPSEAVVAAFERQTRGNKSTWTYCKPCDHPAFREGKASVACGDWAAIKSLLREV